MDHVDLLVVGGGINGAGIARDAAGRGLSVMLVEKDDLAGHTSSTSSKLIHGGLRYLEQFEFRLVRESLQERERLLRAAPHLVRPLEFRIPLGSSGRSEWKLRAGLFLYDRLAGRSVLPPSRPVRVSGEDLKPEFRRALSYWDACVQDSRLVVLNAVDAAERGAMILTRTELISARCDAGSWQVTIRDSRGERTVRARALVNAAGQWTGQLLDRIAGAKPSQRVRLVQGSHIVVPRLLEGEQAFLLQNPDGRVVFAIPFEDDFTLVGTTEIECEAPPAEPKISDAEVDYLLGTIARYFRAPVARDDIAWSFAGVRALVDDGASDPSRVTRDFVLQLDSDPRQAPLLSVFGGKITTYRSLAEQAVDRLAPLLGNSSPRWTASAVLPGGDLPDGDVDRYSGELARKFPELPPELLSRLAGSYGTRAQRLLDDAQSVTDLGEHFGGDLYTREVDYLFANEWARSAEDVLFRRTKLGLRLDGRAPATLANYIAERLN